MISVPNPYLGYSWNSPENTGKTLTEKWGLNVSPDATIQLAPYTEKLVVEVGAEARLFRRASIVLGLATKWPSRVVDHSFADGSCQSSRIFSGHVGQ